MANNIPLTHRRQRLHPAAQGQNATKELSSWQQKTDTSSKSYNVRPVWKNYLEDGHSLSERIHYLHDQLLVTVPAVDRIACAIYEPNDDLLKTFVNSTRRGEAILAYQCKLSESRSLSKLAASREVRVVDFIPDEFSEHHNLHTDWLIKQGYCSSFTVPMYDGGAFLGFLFIDSIKRAAFTEKVQSELILFASLINSIVAKDIATVRTLSASVSVARDFANLRDFETGGHLERMSRYSRIIARAIAPKYQLNDEFIEYLYLFAPLHDIGKIGIPDNILLKPGRLNGEERKMMDTHVEKGDQIIERILGDFRLQNLPTANILRNVIRCHHELMDGSGYPAGLHGNQIPIEARIVAVADIFDALTSRRPYKNGWSVEQACAELARMVELKQLDADCVQAISDYAQELHEIGLKFAD